MNSCVLVFNLSLTPCGFFVRPVPQYSLVLCSSSFFVYVLRNLVCVTSTLFGRAEFVTASCTQISTYCLLSAFPELSLSHERSTPIQVSDAFRGVMTPSLMPAGPAAQHMLAPSSMSVVIVIAAGLPAE